jgi:transposase-like protein
MTRHSWSEDDKKTVRELYQQKKYSAGRIANRMGLRETQVKGFIKSERLVKNSFHAVDLVI